MDDDLTRESPIVKSNNKFTLTGFILGLVAIFFSFIGAIPILAIIFSAIGLSKFNPTTEKHKWQGYIGLALGIIYTLVYMRMYGHI